MDKPIRFCNYKNGALLFVDFNNNAIRTITNEGKVTATVLVDNDLLWIADLYNHQIKIVKLN